MNATRDSLDVINYMTGALHNTLFITRCSDLNRDTAINVLDAAVLFQCVDHGPGSIPAGHSHEPCRFPNRVKNPFQSAQFSVSNINYAAKTIDVHVLNPTTKVLGYQLRLKGITLSPAPAQILTNNYSARVTTKATGEVRVLTRDETVITKQLVATGTLRLKWTSIDSMHVCLQKVVAAANDAYEEIVVSAATPACLTATPTTSIEMLSGSDGHRLYPNPMTSSTRLEILQPVQGAYEIRLLDPAGRTARLP